MAGELILAKAKLLDLRAHRPVKDQDTLARGGAQIVTCCNGLRAQPVDRPERRQRGITPVGLTARHTAFGGDPRPAEHRDTHLTKIAGLGDTEDVSELREWLHVESGDARPLFDQLRGQIIDAVRDGRLPAGTRLPTVRELAGQLGLATNTVARAYRELEAAGLLETRRRFGTFVARADPADAAMAAAAQVYVQAAHAVGLGKQEALRYIEAAFD